MVISGAGVVSSIGNGREAFWEALEVGRSGASRIELDRVGELTACVVTELDEEAVGRREAKRMDRAALFAAVAAAQAFDDAGRPVVDSARIGAVIANVHGGAETIHRSYTEFFERGADRVSPFTIPLGLTNSPVAAVARINGLHGPVTVGRNRLRGRHGRDRPRDLADPVGPGGRDARRGRRGSHLPLHRRRLPAARGALDERPAPGTGVTAVRPCPRRLRDRRGRRDSLPRRA